MKTIDIVLPTEDEMNAMTLEDLKEWRDRLSTYYYNRFDYDFPERFKALRFLWFEKMIENIENGENRWKRIKNF